MIFDSYGNPSYVEDSCKKDGLSESNLLILPFRRYRFMEMDARDAKNGPLDNFVVDCRSLLPGTQLLCVYGDNWFGQTSYSLKAVVSTSGKSAVHKCDFFLKLNFGFQDSNGNRLFVDPAKFCSFDF